MKKNYELLQVKVISLDNEDVITTSAKRNVDSLGANFDLGGLNVQDFS